MAEKMVDAKLKKDATPVEVIFHPSWWHHNCGIEFTKEFFFDPECRVESERKMDLYLYDRFGDLGIGQKNAPYRPVAGPVHLAAGFIVSQLLGCEIRYNKNASPDVIQRNMTDEEVMNLSLPDFKKDYPGNELVRLMDLLEERFGYVEGDFDWSGIQNIALDIRGQQLFIDYYENPQIVRRLFEIITKTLIEFVKYVRGRTGTSSLSVNPSVKHFTQSVNLHSNCSVAMISPNTYEKYLLEYEQYLSNALQPYGIHHCGDNMHHYADSYGKVSGVCFYDVGWGSDVKKCREKLPYAFLNLRLSPVRILNCSASEVEEDIIKIVKDCNSTKNIGVCCINMDYGTPDENIKRIYQVVKYLNCGRA